MLSMRAHTKPHVKNGVYSLYSFFKSFAQIAYTTFIERGLRGEEASSLSFFSTKNKK